MTQLATTQGLYSATSISQSWNLETEAYNKKYSDPLQFPPFKSSSTPGIQSHEKNIPRFLQWSYDGSSFVSIHEDFGIRLFLLDADILAQKEASLVPINRLLQHSPIIAAAVNPNFSLYNESDSDNNMLVCHRGVPIKLISLTPGDEGELLTSYKFEDIRHDKLMETSAIAFNSGGNQFIAGSTNKIAVFDSIRTEPVTTLELPKLGTTSIVSYSSSLSNCVYTGSYIKNEVCVVDANTGDIAMRLETGLAGNGINQVVESCNERYLYSINRNSNEIPILDLRMGLQQVGSLRNWHSSSESLSNKNQKLYADKLSNSRGVIAGSCNGQVKFWKDAELGMDCDCEVLMELDNTEDNVSCVQMNPLDDVDMLAMTVGSRYREEKNEQEERVEGFCGISVWNLENI